MQVVTAGQMQAIEQQAYQQFQVPPLLLMEHAGRAVAEFAWRWLHGQAPDAGPAGPVRLRPPAPWAPGPPPPGLAGRRPRVVALAGKGNNGGDAFCACRHLHTWGCEVSAVFWGDPAALSPDARLNLDACLAAGVAVLPGSSDGAEVARLLGAADLLLDGLLGTGVRGAARGPVAEGIAAGHAAGRPILAIDLPSGVDSDSGAAAGPAVRATWTLALGLPKRCHVLHPGAARAGQVWVAPIGIPAPALAQVAGAWAGLDLAAAGALLPRLPADTHKGSRGRVLVAGGSRAMPGAPALAALAALRAGAGLVVAGVPEPAGDLVAARAPELITLRQPAGPDGGLGAGAQAGLQAEAARCAALAVGPGLGESAGARAVARALALAAPAPVVLDADGLRAFAGEPEALQGARSPVVLTPHPGEAAALLGAGAPAQVQADRPGALAELVRRSGQVVVLKGAYTLVGAPDGRVWVNLTGNRGLGTAGSGDVLTGIIAALLAQGAPAPAAAAAGVCLHGHAADRLAARLGPDGLLAGDLPAELPAARRDLEAWEDTWK